MKNKTLIIGLGLGVGAYLLWKLSRKKSESAVEEVTETVESTTQTGGVKPSKSELSNEQVLALFKRANNYYRGGARPTQELIDRINKDRMEALKEVEERGLTSGFKSWKAGEDAKNLLPMSPPTSGVVLKDKRLSTMPYGLPIMLGSGKI